MGKFVLEDSDNVMEDRVIGCKIVLFEVLFIYFDESEMVVNFFCYLLNKLWGIVGVNLVIEEKNNFIILV